MANESRILASPRSVVSETSVTRPANTTQYAAGEVITADPAAVLTFANCAAIKGGSGVILAARVVDGANLATKADLELWIFDAAPTPPADNAAFVPTDDEMETLVGVIDLGSAPIVGHAGSDAAGNCVFEAVGLNRVFVCAETSRDLYGLLVVRNTYTPVSAEKFTARLEVLQD